MSISYKLFGETGEPVVLVHGSMTNKDQWRPLAGLLKESYRVIAIDLYGYGDMPLPENLDTYSLADESRLISRVVKKVIGDEPYHLVGHSYGGVVAFFHAFYNKNQVKTLTAFEPMSFHLLDKSDEYLTGSAEAIKEMTALINDGRSMEAAESFMNLWVPAGTFQQLPDSEKERLAKGVKKMVLDFRAASTAPLATVDYETLEMPVCLIAGKKSPDYSLAITDLFINTLKNKEVNWVSGGHFAPISHPMEVNPIISGFIKEGAFAT